MMLLVFTVASFLSDNSVAFPSPISSTAASIHYPRHHNHILTTSESLRRDLSSTSWTCQSTASAHHRNVISPLFSYSSNNNRNNNRRRRTSSHTSSSSSAPLFNTNHIKIRQSPPSSSSSSSQSITNQLDRLRVELMRSQLSTRLAEQRAHQLEAQLGEERKKREGIQRELNREKKRRYSNDVNDNKNRVMPSHHAKKKDTTTITSSTPFVGSSLDDLPPFAAALAANAEREEMEKRRKLGLLVQEEQEEDDDVDEMKLLDLGFNVNDNEYALNLEVDNSIKTVPSRTDSLVTTQKQQQTKSLEFNSSSLPMISSSDNKTTSLASSDTNFNLFSTINNNTINTINSQYTPQYINDDIQTLRQNCILLTHQRATLQQKLKASENSRKSLSNELKSSIASERVLRGLQADWTRRLSDTRKEMDAQKEQWKKDLRAERREWKNDRSALERQIQVLEVEQDELTVLLENQKNITFVMGLFCELARECMVSSLRDGKERVVSTCCNSAVRTWNMVRFDYSGKIHRPNRMLTVGGAGGGQTDGIRRRDAILIWVDEMFQRVKSWRQSIGQHRNEDDSQLTPPKNTMTNQEVSTSTEERMPLLIRKNPRRSRLSQPQTVFKRRIRNVDSDLPDFMKG